MSVINIDSTYITKFILVFLRASVFISLLPFFSSKNFPMQFKIGFMIAMTLLITPFVDLPKNNIFMPFLVIREIILGTILGAAVRVIFYAVDLAGQLMSNSMGLSIATVFNPEMGQSTEVARLYGIIAMLVMLAIDAHHDLIYVFVKSYEWIPAGQTNSRDLILKVVSEGSRVFVIALKIAAPVAVGMIMASLLLGFVYKAAPQINIFFVSFPVYLGLGFLIMILSIPVFVNVFIGNFNSVREEMYRILAIARG